MTCRSLHLSVNDHHGIIAGGRLFGRIRLNNLTHTSSGELIKMTVIAFWYFQLDANVNVTSVMYGDECCRMRIDGSSSSYHCVGDDAPFLID